MLDDMRIETHIREYIAIKKTVKAKYIDIIKGFYHGPLMEELGRKWRNGRNVYPSYYRHYAKGYFKALCDNLWQDTEFCYKDDNGIIYSTHKDSVHQTTKHLYDDPDKARDLSNMQWAHLWKGADKLFSDDWHMPSNQ